MLFGLSPFVFWIGLLILCCVIEALTVQLVSLWFAAGSLGALLAAWFGLPILWQWMIFALLSLLLLLLLRPMVAHLLHPGANRTNADRIVGMAAIVTETIDNQSGTGQIRLLSQTWTARTIQEGVIVPEGSTVYVESIQGVKAMVVLTQNELGGIVV